MAFFKWETLKFGTATGVANGEQLKLIDLIGRILEMNTRQTSRAELTKALRSLILVAEQSFSHEEQHLISTRSRKLSTQVLIHRNLRDELACHVRVFEKSKGEMSKNFLSFLRTWLSSQIQYLEVYYGSSSPIKRAS